MSKNQSSTLMQLAVVAACVLSLVSCGGDMLRTGRSPAYLVVDGVTAQQGGTSAGLAFLDSDVQDADGTVHNDNVTVTLSVELKNPAVASTAMNAVTITRYRVTFRRSDGRNTPGVDVPYGFDGGVSATIPVGGTAGVSFEIVRRQAKLEPPLKNLAGVNVAGVTRISGLGFISTIAEITIWGRDQNGNEVTANASIDVHFGDFGDV